MQIYVLDRNLETILVIDEFTSLIWANRYVDNGDAELYLPATKDAFEALRIGNYMARADDDMVTIIRSVEIDTNQENGNYLIVKALDVKSFMDQRVNAGESFVGPLEKMLILRIHEALDAGPMGTNLRGLWMPAGRRLFVASDYTYTLSGELTIDDSPLNLGDVVRGALRYMGWGIKFYVTDDGAGPVIKPLIYKGAMKWDEVIFSREYDNLISTKYIENSDGVQNAALSYDDITVNWPGKGYFVWYKDSTDRFEIPYRVQGDARIMTYQTLTEFMPGGTIIAGPESNYAYWADDVYYPWLPGDPTNSNSDWEIVLQNGQLYRHFIGSASDSFIHVIAFLDTQTPSADTEVTLYDYAHEEVLRQRCVSSISGVGQNVTFEAEVDPVGTFVYKQDYDLGDVVCIENDLGMRILARLVEMIEVEDENGYSLQPKFEYLLSGGSPNITVVNGTYSITAQTASSMTIKMKAIQAGYSAPALEDIFISGAAVTSYTTGTESGLSIGTLVLAKESNYITVYAEFVAA